MSDPSGLTVSEWHSRIRDGTIVLRQELLDGEAVVKAPMSIAHAEFVLHVHRLIEAAVGEAGLTHMHLPVTLDERSEPTPDVSVLGRPNVSGGGRSPIFLVVEVADTEQSLIYNRGRKAAYYARSGVPDCWVLDMAGRQLLVHASAASGGYRSIRNLRPGSTVSLTALPDVTLDVAEMLAPNDD
jgi:Uma2 family endonuclease